MFKKLRNAIGQHVGQPLSNLGARLIPDQPRRKRSWLYFRKALALWLGRDKSTVWLYCDLPNIYEAKPLEVSGPVVFKGWALSARGIASVSFYCDGIFLGEASRGIARPDVAVLATHLKQSTRSGFHYVLDSSGLSAGLHLLSIKAQSIDGSTASSTCTIRVIYSPDDYAFWRSKRAASPGTLAWMKRHAGKLLDQPCLSLVMAIPNETQPAPALATIRSLQEQAYHHWQLCIACDKPAFERFGEPLVRMAEKDRRVDIHVEPFAGPGAAPHYPIDGDCGEFLGLVDAGDLLEPDALFEVVYHLNRDPDVDFFYTDEDMLVAPVVRDRPILKPDWSPELSQRMHSVGRLWLARRELLLQTGGLSPDLDAVKECELLLKLTRAARKVCHLRSVLYSRSRPCQASSGPGQPVERMHYSAEKKDMPVLTAAPFPLLDLEQIRNILMVMLDHLGDVVLTFPAIRRLRSMFPHAHISALVGSWSESLARMNGCINDVLTYDFFAIDSSDPHRLLDLEEKRRIEAWLSSRGFDLAIDFRREPETRDFLRLSRARYTAGFSRGKNAEWLTVAVPYEANMQRLRPRRHVVQELVHLVEMIAIAGRSDLSPQIDVTDAEQAAMAELIGSLLPRNDCLLVAIHPGSGRPIKCWPAEYFAGLADLLVERLDAKIVLFGAISEIALVQTIQDQMRCRCESISLAGRLTIRQFLAALKPFDLFVGNDSGPTHMAAASGLPTLCLCSGTIDPTQWAPVGPATLVIHRPVICSPCYLRDREECPFDVACLRDLSVDAVWSAVIRTLLPRWAKLAGTPEFASNVERRKRLLGDFPQLGVENERNSDRVSSPS